MSRSTTTHLHRGAAPRARRIVGTVAAAVMVMSAGGLLSAGSASAAVTTSPSLGSATSFAVLAGAAATLPAATITGDVGAGAAVTNAGSVIVGVQHPSNDGPTQLALKDLKDAYKDLKSRDAGGNTIAGDDLGGKTLKAGVYHNAAALAATSDFTLDGNATDVFIIQTDAAMNTTASTKMILTGGALASNVYFVPTGAATLGASSVFEGNLISGAAVTIGASSKGDGRALSVTAAVTLGASVTINNGLTSATTTTTSTSAPTSSGSCASSTPSATTAAVSGHTFGAETTFSVLAAAAATLPGATMSGEAGAGAALTVPAATIGGTAHTSNDAATVAALSALSADSSFLKGLTATKTITGDDLGGKTITDGVYYNAAALAATTDFTFDALGCKDAVFVIQTDAALNTTASTKMILANGAQASNIYFVPTAAATLGASSVFEGNIFAGAAVTVGASSTVDGSARSVTAAVTLGATVKMTNVTPAVAGNNGGSSGGTGAGTGSPSCPSTVAPTLGSAASFAVLAGAATTIPGATITGDVGAAAAVTVSGSMIVGIQHPSNDGPTMAALNDLSNAYNNFKALTPTGTLSGDDLGGQTITPGVYHRAAALAATSAVTFDGKCNPNAVFVIQSDAAMNTTASTAMVLLNGAKASNIYFVPTGAATLGASSTFDGTIIAGAAVTIGASSTLNGRALSVTAAVTLGATVTIQSH